MPSQGTLRGISINCNAMLAALLLAAAAPASATIANPVLFNFNSISLTGNAVEGNPSAGSIAIGNYMTTGLQNAGYKTSSVAVTGAIAVGSYNADGKTVGPTLGTSDGCVYGAANCTSNSTPDLFLINNNFAANNQPRSDQFLLSFTNFSIAAISFDWEIFPDFSCPNKVSCSPPPNASSHWPDMELFLNMASPGGTPAWSQIAQVPTNNTISPQNLGTANLTFSGNVTQLLFVDWPSEVGIDNLNITPSTRIIPQATVPEPSSLLLAALALSILAINRPRRKFHLRTRLS